MRKAQQISSVMEQQYQREMLTGLCLPNASLFASPQTMRTGWTQRTTSEGLISHSSPTQPAGGSERPAQQPVSSPFVAILRKTRSHFRKKKYQSPLFFSFSASSQTGRSLFRDFKRGFCTVGQTPVGLPTLKISLLHFQRYLLQKAMFLLFIFFSLSVLSCRPRLRSSFFFLFVCCFCPSSSFDVLHLVWKSRFREQKTKNVALRVQMFRIIPTGCFCFFLFFFLWEGMGGFWVVRDHSQLRISAWLVVDSKKKNLQKKYFLSRTFAMAAHIPLSHGNEHHCPQVKRREVKKKKKERQKMRMDESVSFLSSLQCYYFALVLFIF